MQVTLNLTKKLEKAANEYFEQAKKARKKAEGARKTILKFKKDLERLKKKQAVEVEKEEQKNIVPVEWYEKFRWFISSEGFLCIGGRDATSNEIVIKKHTEPNDIVFHTEAPSSPFFVIKAGKKKPSDITKKEVAIATASFSKAWKLGVASTETYAVKPEQLSRHAEAGEYLPKGGFMVRGKRTYYPGVMDVAVGKLPDDRVMAGPQSAVKANCNEYVVVQQGKDKPSDCAKKIAKKLNVHVDQVVKVLPAGTCQIKK